MAEQKKHKQEKPNPTEPTPREKKIRDLRASGFSLSEIAVKLQISRQEAELPFSKDLKNQRDADTASKNKEARAASTSARQENEALQKQQPGKPEEAKSSKKAKGKKKGK